jgi:hypothetical protein
MSRFTKSLILAGGLGASLLAINTPVRADIIPQLSLVTPVGSEFRWDYTVTLTAEQFLHADATPSLGSFFTIYDFDGYVAGSAVAPNADWTFVADPGLTPGDVTITDNAGIPNLTWKYTGADTNGPLTIGTFSARSIFDDQTLVSYAGHARKLHPGYLDNATPTSNKGITIAPINPVPEPCSMALLGLGAAPLLRLRRRNRKA